MTSLDPRFALLRPLVEAPERSVVLTDFDGTLAPIVLEPAKAQPLPGAVTLLHRLALRFGRVGVVSGRPVPFLRDRLECEEDVLAERLLLVGLYGMECSLAGRIVDHPEAVAWRPAVDEVATAAEAAVPPGVSVERKGLSVAIHFRNAPDADDWVLAFVERQSARSGLAVVQARMAYELRPPIDVDKGTVVTELTEGFEAALFVGDDRGDLDAFAALDQRRAEAMHVVKVAVRSAEAPPELEARADLVVEGTGGAFDLLSQLLAT